MVTVELSYTLHGHRYWPKLSADGKRWQRAGSGSVRTVEGGGITLRLALEDKPLWVSAQEIVDNASYDQWMQTVSARPDLMLLRLGSSTRGRPVNKLESTWGGKKIVLLVGRQHPPEVTGALAMRSFIERLLAGDALAQRFRANYALLAVPNMNPDGVALGHWRHNVNGVDLNRDWGPFTQTETQLLRDELARLKSEDSEIELFIDFHSTQHDVFYTQPAELETNPAGFIARWLSKLQTQLYEIAPGYPIREQAGHTPTNKNSKTYMYETYGVPAITLEIGDEVDREFISAYASSAATAMMETLLD